MNLEWLNALMGGVIIGISVSLMLLFNGRVTGISGIVNGARVAKKSDTLWRVFFIVGLIFGGFIMKFFKPEVFVSTITNSNLTIIIAGLLVGFGTILGSGCTSGHGICGISRLSVRSLLATLSFIIAGVVIVYFFRSAGLHQ